jgi:NAD(P)-dependent dehydrogenase (short-subunit alcohol dehydrogenase family)
VSFEPSAALIVGVGDGLSAALARGLRRRFGCRLALAARDPAKLVDLASGLDAITLSCDAAREDDVEALFTTLDRQEFVPDVVIYNPSFRTRGALVDLAPDDVRRAWEVGAFGAFLVARQAVRRWLARAHQVKGKLLFTGASASVKGYPLSAPFAMGKFALRGLAQSLARELHPQGIHVGHVVVDGAIASTRRPVDPAAPDAMLDPTALADAYLHLIQQPPSAWSWEIEVRPWVERF